jgi:hypothetical protein
MTVSIHDAVGGNDTHTFAVDSTECIIARCADDLQELYDTRNVAVSPALHDDAFEGSYIAFRAQDHEAEAISLMGMFYCYLEHDALPSDELDEKLSWLDSYKEEKQFLDPFAWVIGFRGFVINRSELPEIIAKLRSIANWR